MRAATKHASRSSVNTDPGGGEPKPGGVPPPGAGVASSDSATKDSGGDTSEPSLTASELVQQQEGRPKLQRQKAQSRKTFKFRKTRKEASSDLETYKMQKEQLG